MFTRHTLTAALAGLTLLGTLSACDSFTNNVDELIDRTPSDSLDNQREVPFLATGVKQSFNSAYDQLAIGSDLLSDQFVYDSRANGASFPTYGEIDIARIVLDNNTVRNAYRSANEYRYQADDLLRRATTTIAFTDDAAGVESKRLALFTANLHGGISRYFLGSYFGKEPAIGGAPISTERNADLTFKPSPTIPTAELYAQAIQKYTTALESAGTPYETRLVNTLIARTYLFLGDRTQAGAFAARGLTSDDEAYTGRYSTTSSNDWYFASGAGRVQIVVAPRFVASSAAGDKRTPVIRTANVRGTATTVMLYRQNLYTEQTDPIVFASWQENNLIRAEAALIGGAGAEAALPFVNQVRLDAGIAALTTFDQAALISERDKTLFTQGQRLIDERRFDIFHTETTPRGVTAPIGPFRFLPITQDERDANTGV